MSVLTLTHTLEAAAFLGAVPLAAWTNGGCWWVAATLATLAAGACLWRYGGCLRKKTETAPATIAARGVFDLTFVFVAFDNFPGLRFGIATSLALLVATLSWRLLLASVGDLYRREASQRVGAFLRWIGAEIVFVGVAVWLTRKINPSFTSHVAWSAAIAHATLSLAAIGWARWCQPKCSTSPGEGVRFGLLLTLALALTHPWFSPSLVGTGDGRLYYETLQEFFNQLHVGIWPPWISQSEIAPFGALFPFRLATYHYYFAALLDGLTGKSLTTYGVQHLTIVLSFVAGGWSMYAVLRRLVPAFPWIAWALAAIYLMSPAWLGPLYGFTMIFTIMTLPFIPFALAGAWPAIGARNLAAATVHGAVLAASWHAHLPVGFWISITVLLAQAVGWCVVRPGWKVLSRQLFAWLVCAVLCSGLWWSIISLHYMSPHQDMSDGGAGILRVIKSAFPASVLPAAASPAGLADIQLGYALALALVAATLAALRRHQQVLVWLVPAGILSLLLFPVPWFTVTLWSAMPMAVRDLTGTWPVQRLIGPLTGAATLAGALGLAALAARSIRWRKIVAVASALLLGWSGAEAVKYLRRGYRTILPAALSENLSRRENSPLLLNWLAFHNHTVPAFYLTQTTYDARLYNRIWSRDRSHLLADNYAHVMAEGAQQPPVSVTANPLAPSVWRLMPRFDFEGGKRFLFELMPTAHTVPGVFNLTSADLVRSVTTLLPGGPAVTQPIWTTPVETQVVEFTYLPTNPALADKPVEDFLRYRLVPYDPATLPIAVKTYAPYVARLNAPEPGWLETHRVFTEGYRATVNGRPADALISPDARVMVGVPAGISRVQLDYVGTPSLRFTFGLMAVAWLALGLWGILRFARGWSPSRSAVTSGRSVSRLQSSMADGRKRHS